MHKGDAQTRRLENPTNKLLWGLNISDFKSAWWTQARHNIFKEKWPLEVKLTETKAALLKQNNKEEKEILPLVTQYQPLVSIIKEALMKKWNLIQKQPLLYHDKILKNYLKCYISWSEKGKLWQRTCLLVPKHKRDRCEACHPLQFFTKNNWSIQKAGVHWLINYFLLCPVVYRETKFTFTIKALVILSVLIIFIWQKMHGEINDLVALTNKTVNEV